MNWEGLSGHQLQSLTVTDFHKGEDSVKNLGALDFLHITFSGKSDPAAQQDFPVIDLTSLPSLKRVHLSNYNEEPSDIVFDGETSTLEEVSLISCWLRKSTTIFSKVDSNIRSLHMNSLSRGSINTRFPQVWLLELQGSVCADLPWEEIFPALTHVWIELDHGSTFNPFTTLRTSIVETIQVFVFCGTNKGMKYFADANVLLEAKSLKRLALAGVSLGHPLYDQLRSKVIEAGWELDGVGGSSRDFKLDKRTVLHMDTK